PTRRSPDLADRIADAANPRDVRAIELGGARADPGEMRRQMEPAPLARYLPRERLFIVQGQRPVRGKEIDPPQAAGLAPGDGLHEAYGMTDVVGNAFEFRGQR